MRVPRPEGMTTAMGRFPGNSYDSSNLAMIKGFSRNSEVSDRSVSGLTSRRSVRGPMPGSALGAVVVRL